MSITVTKFLKAVKNVCDTARINGYKYGNSTAMPPTSDKIISCDRMIAKALWDLGFKDQTAGGITIGNMEKWLKNHGWEYSTKTSAIKKGSIVMVKGAGKSNFSHTFVVVSYNAKTRVCTKYDCGSKTRIDTVQPFKNEGWGYQADVKVFNLPVVKTEEKKSDTSEKKTETSEKKTDAAEKKTNTNTTTTKSKVSLIRGGFDYSAVYNYTYYKKRYADLQKAFGNKEAKYFEHFLTFGMKEGRKAKKNFDVHVYRRRYVDLQRAFGNDLPAYYKHYIQYGKKEGRKAT